MNSARQKWDYHRLVLFLIFAVISATSISSHSFRTGLYKGQDEKTTNFTRHLVSLRGGAKSMMAPTSMDEQMGNLPVVYISGALTQSQTWSADKIYVVGNGAEVPSGITLTINAATIVKYQNGSPGISVGQGGSLNANGTTSAPITFTSYKDDIGGDSNNDGPSQGSMNDYGTAISVNGGNVEIVHANFQYATLAVDKTASGVTTITDSNFDSGIRSDAAISLKRNYFNSSAQAYRYGLDLSGDPDISTIALSGSDSNHFSGPKVAVFLLNSVVPADKSWTVDSASGAILYVGNLNDDGSMSLDDGVIVKVTQGGVGLNVDQGASLNVSGGILSPVMFTSYRDDSVGGDTNNDGSSTGSVGDYGTAINAAGGAVSVSHAIFNFSKLAVDKLSGGSTSITDSVINSSIRSEAPISVERNQFNTPPGGYYYSIDLSDDPDVSGVVLAGSNENIFNGSSALRTILLFNSTVPANASWSVDSTSNAILYSASGFSVGGSMGVGPGVIIKAKNYATAIHVLTGGRMTASGASTEPAYITSYRDDSVGGDTNNDGLSIGGAGDYGIALLLDEGGSVNFSNVVIKYASEALDSEGGVATFDQATVDQVNNGLYVPAGQVTYRGAITNVSSSGHAVQACDWNNSSCGVDAAYTDWGTMGPSAICGKVLDTPWSSGGAVHTGILFTGNCDSSSNPYQQVQNSGLTFGQLLADKQESCSQGGLEDACDQADVMVACVNGAINIINNTSPFPLSQVASVSDAEDYADLMNGQASSFIQSKVVQAATSPEVDAIYGSLKSLADLFSSMQSAFDNC